MLEMEGGETLNMQGFTQADIQTIANLPESKALLKSIQQTDAAAIKRAVEHIKAGSMEQAMALLEPMAKTAGAQKLIQEIQKKIG